MLRILLVGACVGAARLREADDNRESALTRGRGGGGSLRKLVHSPTARARQNVRYDATSRPSEKKPSDHVTCPAAAESQYVRRLGDGVCDVALNTEGCGWDLKSHAIFFRKTCYNTPHPEDESERGAVLTEPGHGSRREGGSVWRA